MSPFSGSKSEFPEFSIWRNNLVAASRCYNYVFLASRSRIHVYQPTYPSQAFPEKPLYILDSTPSTPSRGYIDPRNPHAINSLTIGDLGIEEVLVSAHDDGDVCVWYTRDLTRIALRWNVGVSAWGVALHKEKRLLAVSANSHWIHVFDLGMRDEERKAKKARRTLSNNGETRQRMTMREGQDEADWSNNTTKILKGHAHNIPSISFLDDPSGNWLVGTSIDGMVIVWDIERKEIVSETRLCDGEKGWSVLFLQLECFLPTRNEGEGLGGSDIITSGEAYDISPSRNALSSDSDDFDSGVSDSDEGESGDDGETEDYDDDDDVASDDFLETNESSYHYTEASEVESSVDHSMDEAGDDDESLDGNSSHWTNTRLSQTQEINLDNGSLRQTSTVLPGAQERPLATGTEATPSSYSNHRSIEKYTAADIPTPSPPPSYIFSTSDFNVQLLGVASPSLDSIVICQHVLPSKPAPLIYPYSYLGNIDRLNMVCVVPELSMVVVASQQGRAAIFRLTQNEAGYMMRLDDMLPREPNDAVRSGTNAEDEPQVRPRSALLGIAVGPIQGREFGRSRRNSENNTAVGSDSDDDVSNRQETSEVWARKKRGVWRGLERRRRYRFMMVYNDGSILSYELGGTPDSELAACTVEGGYLMV